MGIEVIRRGRMPKFNTNGVARMIKGTVPGAIIARARKGEDTNGHQFAPYSARYIRQLQRMGESTVVDLRLSGGMLNSIKARETIIRNDSVEVVVAPDTGTSPVWKANPKRPGKATRAKVKAPWGNAGEFKQGPPHNQLAAWLHYGTAHMKARPFMGLTEQEWTDLLKNIAGIMWR